VAPETAYRYMRSLARAMKEVWGEEGVPSAAAAAAAAGAAAGAAAAGGGREGGREGGSLPLHRSRVFNFFLNKANEGTIEEVERKTSDKSARAALRYFVAFAHACRRGRKEEREGGREGGREGWVLPSPRETVERSHLKGTMIAEVALREVGEEEEEEEEQEQEEEEEEEEEKGG